MNGQASPAGLVENYPEQTSHLNICCSAKWLDHRHRKTGRNFAIVVEIDSSKT
jgi:hypothetical protein